MAYKQGNRLFATPNCQLISNIASGSQARIDAATERIGASFCAGSTSAITDIALNLNVTGTIGAVNFRLQIQGDSSNSPDGVNLGSPTPTFNVSADGWCALQTLAANTGALTIGKRYWVVLDVESDPSAQLGASNYIELNRDANAIFGEGITLYTGTWTGQAWLGLFVCKHLDGTYSGFPFTSAAVYHSLANTIFSTNRQGLRFKCGSQVAIAGFCGIIHRNSTPNSLIYRLYESTTLKATGYTMLQTEVISGNYKNYLFPTPVLCAADTNLYIVLSQESDGGDSTNRYQVQHTRFPIAYAEAALPGADWRFVYGTGDDPTTYTVDSAGYAPRLGLIITDMATEFDQAAAGGVDAVNLFKALIDT